MDPAIVTEGLTKFYGGSAAVDRLDLSVPAGAIFAFLGDNGAGKSTTIRMLTGQLPPDAGSARVLGEDCWQKAVSLRHRVGYVPERPKLYDWMTVGEIGWFAGGFHKPGYRERYALAARRFELDPAKKLKNLSKGGYARVGLALALACDPEVLILDEPTSGLDLQTRREFLASMVDLAGGGRTILISSHGIAEVERVASHVGFLAAGQLRYTSTVEELKRRVVRVRVRYAGPASEPGGVGEVLGSEVFGSRWDGVVRDLDAGALDRLRAQANVTEVDHEPVTLEDAYLALVGRREGRGATAEVAEPVAGGGVR